MRWPSLVDVIAFALAGATLLVFAWEAPVNAAARPARAAPDSAMWQIVRGADSWVGPDAPHPMIVVFTDYSCTYCRRLHRMLLYIRPASAKVAIRFLPSTRASAAASIAAMR